ncbi:TetR/AcrR family transcriptional regulator [Hydrocarboniclastica marina]|uniref:TetR/AcrR family transcriptional regulator n=1 Tax=Hydrocarboniclastica marina TaxID=2259620 RepID=A0A4V1D954_9ALTE|nr:TetR/AcrR family transcriptional regulator [Hydrocarboniclastica marina]MAM00170.1 TetR family transcriptional regulator [Alteromonadaceae bacterium]QCF27500.1 TetR/AcrR family transcriptional regulator [Hydrocarboniclastica marina]|tara:strand:+ start:1911 stop:2615 length:705 start_codon:yes stop_codon:yes gene_type:complete
MQEPLIAPDHRTADEDDSVRRQERSEVTKQRILDASERLFASKSFASVSLREIAKAASVGVATVNYHLGSKDDLLKAVFLRRATELNRERVALLSKSEQSSNGSAIPLRQIMRALLLPGIRWSFDQGQRGLFIQFMIRCQLDPSSPLYELFYRDVRHLQRFVPHLKRTLPELDEADIHWRLHFTLGALHYTITDLNRLDQVSNGLCNTSSMDETVERIVTSSEAAFRAGPFGAC